MPNSRSEQETTSIIESFIRRRFRVQDDDESFGVDVNLWEAGYVDSAGAIEMIAFLEETFGITLPEDVLFDPEFAHIRGMARMLRGDDVSRVTGPVSVASATA
ncbi:MAG TPA: acyl carrier protein [Polyangiaceae bacterium]